jgi:hypothetical protein
MKPTITRKNIAYLRSEVANPNRFEPVLVNPNMLRALLDAVEALDQISEIAFQAIGPGIGIALQDRPTTLEDL